MATVKNVSPLGDLDVPALRITVPAGATVDVPDEVAANLLEQVGTWASGESKKNTNPAPADPAAN